MARMSVSREVDFLKVRTFLESIVRNSLKPMARLILSAGYSQNARMRNKPSDGIENFLQRSS
jgi:hypothetical protein